MTRKHYKQFAQQIKHQPDRKIAVLMAGLIIRVVRENANFDREKFITACGLDNEAGE